MRVLQSFWYALGAKPPFDQLPAIIDEFLRIHGLTHRIFHYCFENLDLTERFRSTLDGTKCQRCDAPQYVCAHCRDEAERYLRKGTGCQRAAKEHPFLGKIHVKENKGFIIQALHNFDNGTNDSKEAIYGILTKIYRRYGFSETQLIYRDIDFFSRRTASPSPEFTVPMRSYPGSSITVRRSGIPAGNAVVLTIASDNPSDVPDATIYAEALKQHLNCKDYLSTTNLIMSEEEQLFYDDLNRRAAPLVQASKDLFTSHMPEEKGNDDPPAPVKVAPLLRKLARQFGYTYKGYSYYVYFLEKTLPNGHYVCLEFVSNPRGPCADPFVNLCGLGFNHRIWVDGFDPQNPRDASAYFTRLFDVLAEAEETVFPAILDLYPPTPDWFVPTH